MTMRIRFDTVGILLMAVVAGLSVFGVLAVTNLSADMTAGLPMERWSVVGLVAAALVAVVGIGLRDAGLPIPSRWQRS
jgi:hypothetical protein